MRRNTKNAIIIIVAAAIAALCAFGFNRLHAVETVEVEVANPVYEDIELDEVKALARQNPEAIKTLGYKQFVGTVEDIDIVNHEWLVVDGVQVIVHLDGDMAREGQVIEVEKEPHVGERIGCRGQFFINNEGNLSFLLGVDMPEELQ